MNWLAILSGPGAAEDSAVAKHRTLRGNAWNTLRKFHCGASPLLDSAATTLVSRVKSPSPQSYLRLW